jgi:starch phosphorylase
VEMSERIGREHMFIFGMTASQVNIRKQVGDLNMDTVLATSERLKLALEAIREGVFSPDDPARYTGLVDSLINEDRFMVCADFDAYWEAQRRVDQHWQSPDLWWASALLNCSRMGWFSSDRAIREYATDIWGVPLNKS